jgi:hypothetical protein
MNREGTIVIVVLVIVVLLTYSCYQFVDRMAVENIAAKTQAETTQLGTCVSSGEELLRTLLAYPTSVREQLGGIYDQQNLLCSRIVYDRAVPYGRGRFTVIAPRIAENKVAGLRFGVVNESGKLSLGGLLDWERRQPGVARQALLQLPGMEKRLADSLLDWIDSDSMTREEGAEAAEYGALGVGAVAITPPNTIVRTLDDLLPVSGMSRLLLLGPDRNVNFHVSMKEQLTAESSTTASDTMGPRIAEFESGSLPWSYYLTPYSAERNQSRDGRPRIYLNDPDLVRLHSELTKRFPSSWVNFILLYRQFGPSYESGGNPKTSEVVIDIELPAQFSIETIYDLLGAHVRIPVNTTDPSAEGQLRLSPFSIRSKELSRYLQEFADQVTVSPRRILSGRVNINRALRPVLLAVPGLNEELVEKILEIRGDPEQERKQALPKSFIHESWLLTKGLVEIHQMRALAPYVTTRGAVHRGQIVGYFDQGPLALRTEVVMDATFSPPRTIFHRDLHHLGRGYSLDVLQGGRLSSEEDVIEEL